MRPSDSEILQLYELEWMLEEESTPLRRVNGAWSFVRAMLVACAYGGTVWFPMRAFAHWLYLGLPK